MKKDQDVNVKRYDKYILTYAGHRVEYIHGYLHEQDAQQIARDMRKKGYINVEVFAR